MSCACVAAPCLCDDPIPGVSDWSILDIFKARTPVSPDTVGGVDGNSAASQDVPPGDTRAVTDGTVRTQNTNAPSTLTLLWNTITRPFGSTGPALFSCRPDSYLCAGTGQAAAQAGMTVPAGGNSGALTVNLILVVAALVIGLLVIRKVAP